MQDPFAQYAVHSDDPFAAYAVKPSQTAAPTAEDMLTHRVGAETNPAGTTPSEKWPLVQTMQASLSNPLTYLGAPTDATRSVTMGILRRIPSVFKATAQNTQPGLASKLSFPVRAVGEFNETLPSTMAKRVQEFKGAGATPAATPAQAAPSVPDVVDRALMRGRLQTATPEPGAAPAATSSEDASRAFNARYFRDAEQQRQVLGQIQNRPEMIPSHEPVSPLRGPRINIGAEQVGRQEGMTKDAVRQVTGPILDEARGEASPILPQTALTRIIDDMKALPPGAEREAYVARATSGKAKWQVENIRRTLEHLGLVVPMAGLVREQLQRLMASHATEGQR